MTNSCSFHCKSKIYTEKTQQTNATVQVKSMQIFVPSSNHVYYVSIDMAVVRVKILTRRICWFRPVWAGF